MNRIEKIVQMRNDGLTNQEISIVFGISRERVRQLLKREGYLGKPDLHYKQATLEQKELKAQRNRDKVRDWQLANPEKRKAQVKRYFSKRQQIDYEYRVKKSLVSRYRYAIKNASNSTATTLEFLGCSIEQARLHLESQFRDGMSWDNYGEWEIDHIRPCASFDLTDPEQQRECFHYSNLQPLWREENRLKADTWQFA